MAAVASTSTPQSMVRSSIDTITTNTANITRKQEEQEQEEEEWTPLSPHDSSQQAKRFMLPPIRTLLNEQLTTREPPPSSASSTSSNTLRRRRLQNASPLDDRFENPLPSPASSHHHYPTQHQQSRRPLIPSHSSASSSLMDMHDCILNKQLRRERRRDHRLPHSSSTSTSSSPYDFGRRPSLSSSSHSSSYLDSNSEVVPSPTTMSIDFSSQRAASWVSQFGLQMSMNGGRDNSPLASPISSTGSGNYIFPGPLDTRRRQDTTETIKESDCSPVYSTSSGATSPTPVTPQSAVLQKKSSCVLAAKRLWELPLCISK